MKVIYLFGILLLVIYVIDGFIERENYFNLVIKLYPRTLFFSGLLCFFVRLHDGL